MMRIAWPGMLGLLLSSCGSESPEGSPVDEGGSPTDAGSDAATCASDNGGCDAHASCADASGSIVCTCLPGYEGDGMSCMDVAVSLDGLRWELPCLVHTTAELCTTPGGPVVVSATLAGAAGTTYDVTLRFRGVVEPKTYTGGTRDGFWQEGGAPAADTANIYSLEVSDPAGVFYVNAGTTRPSTDLYCDALDFTRTVPMSAGAAVTLSAAPLDALQILNRDMSGAALVIPDVPPAPAAFDGQFVQMDVLSVTAL